jgi:hypothetical protein
MSKWILPLVAALAMAVAIPSFAGAKSSKKKHNCAVDVTLKVARIAVTSGSPPATGSEVGAGLLDGKVCGKTMHGAVRGTQKYPTPGHFKTTATDFGPLGSVTGKASGTGTVNPDGSISFSGSGKTTGGTGIYKGATGSFTLTGTLPKNSTVATEHVTGTIHY